jgi:hypothetical protein
MRAERLANAILFGASPRYKDETDGRGQGEFSQ